MSNLILSVIFSEIEAVNNEKGPGPVVSFTNVLQKKKKKKKYFFYIIWQKRYRINTVYSISDAINTLIY